MIVKQQLISEIEAIDNQTTLSQLFEILQMVKQNIQIQPKQKNSFLQFAGKEYRKRNASGAVYDDPRVAVGAGRFDEVGAAAEA